MTFEQYSAAFTDTAIRSGYSEENIQHCLLYAKRMFDSGVPVIYNTSHFAGLVGYNKAYLKRAVLNNKYFYKSFDIKKKNGHARTITEPLPSLKEIQTWILYNILYKIPVSKYAKAYIPGISLKQNVVFHKNQKLVMVLDITNFFGSIHQDRIFDIFYSLGYSRILSSLFSQLCCKDFSLPQGAPTSAYLSNLFMAATDEIIASYCVPRKIRYTRYADDLTFSGDFNSEELLEFVTTELVSRNLQVNLEKTRLMSSGERQVVTGIVVNKKLQVPFAKRNKLRQEIFYIKKFGLVDHMNRLKIRQANYLPYLIGRINFILSFNPHDKEFCEYKKFLLNLNKESKADN